MCVIISAVVFLSFKDQYPVINEYNLNTNNLSIEFIDNLNSSLPNITVTTIPIDGIKALYHFKLADYDSAIFYSKKGLKANPFIGFNDAVISDAFLALGNVDSAHFYGKRAYTKLPNNIIHQDSYIKALIKLKNFVKIREIFESHKDSKQEVLYYRYLSAIITHKKIDKEKDLLNVNEAILLFPNNKQFKIFKELIINGIDNIAEANILSDQAKTYYSNKKFNKAIELYLKAEELVPNEPAYKENLGSSYFQLKNYDKALYYYNIVIDSENPRNGRAEYLKGYLYVELKKRILACESFKASANYKNKTGIQLLSKYCNE